MKFNSGDWLVHKEANSFEYAINIISITQQKYNYKLYKPNIGIISDVRSIDYEYIDAAYRFLTDSEKLELL